MAKSMRDWSRTDAVFDAPSIDIIRTGAILRIADSLEKIEGYIFNQTPEGKRSTDQQGSEEKRKNAEFLAEAAIRRRGEPEHRILWARLMSKALVIVCGAAADADNPECWLKVAADAPSYVGGWGKKKSEYLRAWVESQWPEYKSEQNDTEY